MTWRNETEFQAAVIELAELLGWNVYHVARVRKQLRAHSSVGYQDLTLVRGRVALVPELKVGRNTTTDDQRRWLDAWSEVPGAVPLLWRPDAAPRAERWPLVETAEGPDFGAIGRRLRGEL